MVLKLFPFHTFNRRHKICEFIRLLAILQSFIFPGNDNENQNQNSENKLSSAALI